MCRSWTDPVNVAPPAPQYIVSNGDPLRDRDTVLSIWWGNLGQTDRIAAKYDWCYLDSPFPAPVIKLLRDVPGNAWVGSCCAGKRRMIRGEQVLTAGVMADLAVVPAHRTLGPAMMLQQAIVTEAREQLDLLYGFPNTHAVAVFKRSGYTRVTDLVRLVHVLRSAHYLRRHLPGWVATPLGAVVDLGLRAQEALRRLFGQRVRTSWSTRADERMDTLWRDAPRGEVMLTVRNTEYLRWRFDRSPMATTRYLALTHPRTQALHAWFATQIEDGTLHVRDYWTDHGVTSMPTAYVDALLRAARKAGASAVSVQISEREGWLSGWGEREFRERSRRAVYGFKGKDLATEDGMPVLHLSSADEDE